MASLKRVRILGVAFSRQRCVRCRKKDLAFALAMLDDSDGSRLVDIAARMDVTNGYASTYKRRLLKKGVVGERPGGRLDFDIPLLREYLDEFYTE